MLNGDISLFELFGRLGSSVVASVRKVNANGLLAIFGLSALFTAGGTLIDPSRRNSPDLRGGGGEGGCDGDSFGDLLASK